MLSRGNKKGVIKKEESSISLIKNTNACNKNINNWLKLISKTGGN